MSTYSTTTADTLTGILSGVLTKLAAADNLLLNLTAPAGPGTSGLSIDTSMNGDTTISSLNVESTRTAGMTLGTESQSTLNIAPATHAGDASGSSIAAINAEPIDTSAGAGSANVTFLSIFDATYASVGNSGISLGDDIAVTFGAGGTAGPDWTLTYDASVDDALELTGAASPVTVAGTDYLITGSAGGAASGATPGGASGGFFWTGGVGGAAAGGAGAAGAGTDWTITAGAGGAGTATGVAGAGADLRLRAGGGGADGGAGGAGGGDLLLQVGDGTGAGADGDIICSHADGAGTPDLIPRADAEGSVGTAAARWNLIRGVTVTSGAFYEEEVFAEEALSPDAMRAELVTLLKRQHVDGLGEVRHLAKIALLAAHLVLGVDRVD